MKVYWSFIFFFLFKVFFAQNISGVINSYAGVTNIAGSNITAASTAGFAVGDQVLIIQMKGATVVTGNNANFGNITSMGSAGSYEFKDITAIVGSVITVNGALSNVYNVATGVVQIVKVPKYCQPTVTSTLTCSAWNGTTGGVLAFEAGTLTLNANIDVSGLGFRGGNFATSGFCCSNGGFRGPFNVNGGKKGESISQWINNQDGMKGKQANGGGGSNCGNSGGGGGGNAGTGGLGGNEYSGCVGSDERGVGGLQLTQSLNTLFMGGGGGGGFRDNGQVATDGGAGGGIVYIKANQIICNNKIVNALGASVTIIANDEGSGGGGAGGTIFIVCSSYVGNLTVNTSGGNGGSNNNSIFAGDCHGTGGGGGGGTYGFSSAAIPSGVTYIANGGLAGLVMNPASSCFNTTFGAGPGLSGSSIANLPTPVLPYVEPVITIAGNNSICANQQTTLTASTTAIGVTTYTWDTGPTTPTIALAPLVTTVYTVTGSNNTCTATATQTVYVGVGPPITVAGNNTICSSQSTTLTASGVSSYTWSNGSNNSVIIVSPSVTTTYTVTGENIGSGCLSITVFTVTVISTPSLTTAGTYSFCDTQGSATITASGATTYSWSPATGLNNTNSATVIANPTISTTYVLTGFNGACSASINVAVQNYALPVISSIASQSIICSGTSAVLTANGGNTYTWQPSSGILNNTLNSITISPFTTTNYTVFSTSINGCQGSATISVIVIQSVSLLLTTLKNTICNGEQATLVASGAGSYSWSPAASLNSNSGATVIATPQSTQIYTVIGTSGIAPNTCSSTNTISLTVIPVATVTLAGPDSICLGQKAYLYAYGAASYTWLPNNYLNSNTLSNPIATPTAPIIYTVIGSNAGGLCANTKTVSVYVNPNPIISAGRDTSINFDEYTILNGTGSGSIYTWSSSDMSSINCINCPTTYVKPTATTCYLFEVKNSHNCISKDEVCVTIRKEFALYIPNSFTPNGDGINDLFAPTGYGIIDCELTIFNRWGQLLFSNKGNFVDGNFIQWDGKYKNKFCQQGVYTYKFIYTTASKKTETKTGEITIISNSQD